MIISTHIGLRTCRSRTVVERCVSAAVAAWLLAGCYTPNATSWQSSAGGGGTGVAAAGAGSSAVGGAAASGAGQSAQGGSGGSAAGAPPVVMGCGTDPGLKTSTTGRTLSIAPGGNDTADGVQAPLASLRHAAELAQPGDIIEYRAGTYGGGQFVFNLNGTADAPITLRAHAGEKVILNDGNAGGALALGNSSFVIVDGLELTNSTGIGLNLLDSNHITARNLLIHDTYAGAVFARADDVVVEDSVIYNCVMRNASRGTSWDACVQTARIGDRPARNAIFRNLLIHDAFGEGIDQWYSDGGQTIGNVIYDTFSAAIYNDHSSNIRIERNYIYFTSDAWRNPLFANNRPMGIQIATEPPAGEATDYVVANNIILNSGAGISFWNTGGGTYRNLTIAHNVLSGCQLSPISVDQAGTQAGSILANNLIFPGGAESRIGNPEAWMVGHNLWAGAMPSFDSRATSLVAQPQLSGMVAPGAPIANFAPAAASPLLGHGTALPSVDYDFRCMPRSSTAPTIGAFETP